MRAARFLLLTLLTLLACLARDVSADDADTVTYGCNVEHALAVLGPPSTVTPGMEPGETAWTYDADAIFVKDGKVVGWENSGGTLRVFLTQALPSRTALTRGSSLDDVLGSLGDPTSLRVNSVLGVVLGYGDDTLTLLGDKVVGWCNDGGRLPVILGPQVRGAEAVRLGLPIEGVVAALGTPVEITLWSDVVVWRYRRASLTFRERAVAEWTDYDALLRHTASGTTRIDQALRLDWSKSQVFGLLGEPTDTLAMSEEEEWLIYGASVLTLNKGRLTGWSDAGELGQREQALRRSRGNLLARTQALPAPRASGPTPPPAPPGGHVRSGRVAENGTYYGELNENGVPKTVHVDGYYRQDGTYVQGHYRSQPNSNPPSIRGSSSGGSTYVRGYTRKDGTYVSGHYRRK